MTAVTAAQAAAILSTSHMTIHRRVDDGLLKARREGVGRIVKINIEDLRKFAEDYGYSFDEDIAAQYAK